MMAEHGIPASTLTDNGMMFTTRHSRGKNRPEQPTTIDDLQALLVAFVDEYNDHRPHRCLEHRATPATVYNPRPKATPSTGGRDHDTHDRVRYDKIDKSAKIPWRYHGQMYSIGIGRTHDYRVWRPRCLETSHRKARRI